MTTGYELAKSLYENFRRRTSGGATAPPPPLPWHELPLNVRHAWLAVIDDVLRALAAERNAQKP